MSKILMRGTTLVAFVVLVTNDWLLKNCCRSVITGKLSDFAGLYLVASLTAGSVAAVCLHFGCLERMRTSLIFALMALASVYAAVKTTSIGMTSFLMVNGFVVTTAKGAIALVFNKPSPSFQASSGVVDATDLIALIVVPIVYRSTIRMSSTS